MFLGLIEIESIILSGLLNDFFELTLLNSAIPSSKIKALSKLHPGRFSIAV